MKKTESPWTMGAPEVINEKSRAPFAYILNITPDDTLQVQPLSEVSFEPFPLRVVA